MNLRLSNHEKGTLGEVVVARFLKKDGYTRVTRRKSGDKGWDISAYRKGRRYTFEVKCSERDYGIPDMNISEFKATSREWVLVADFLYVVRLINGKPKFIDKIEKKQLDKYKDRHRVVTRIRVSAAARAIKRNILSNRVSI